MLAARRSERLIGRERNEMTSIGTITGMIQAGTPTGTNSVEEAQPVGEEPDDQHRRKHQQRHRKRHGDIGW
jgi:hypothetical protein